MFSTKIKIFIWSLLFGTPLALLWSEPPDAQITSLPLAEKRIMIDPGHGAINPEGTIINPGKTSPAGLEEHKLAMQIAAELGSQLEKEGAQVIFTRTWADYWRESLSPVEDNKSRALFANQMKVDAYLSIHCDWHPNPRVHGVTTFYLTGQSQNLARSIQSNLVEHLKARNRKVVRDSYTVLDGTQMPAVLIETGFLSHRRESQKLADPDYQTRVAQAISQGVRDFFKN